MSDHPHHLALQNALAMLDTAAQHRAVIAGQSFTDEELDDDTYMFKFKAAGALAHEYHQHLVAAVGAEAVELLTHLHSLLLQEDFARAALVRQQLLDYPLPDVGQVVIKVNSIKPASPDDPRFAQHRF